MNEKKFNFPTVVATQLWQHDTSLLMRARELPHNLAKIVILQEFQVSSIFLQCLKKNF